MANDPFYYNVTDLRSSLSGEFRYINNECYLNFENNYIDEAIIDEIYLLIKEKSSLYCKIIISNINNISDKNLQHMKNRFTSIPGAKEIIFL